MPLLLILICVVGALALRQWDAARVKRKEAEEARSPMRCPLCGYDMRASADRCPECGLLLPQILLRLDPQKLRDDWPANPIEVRVPGFDETLVLVWEAPHEMAGQLLVNQLEARGVKAVMEKQARSIQPNNTAAPPPRISVSVYANDLEMTQLILKRFERTGE